MSMQVLAAALKKRKLPSDKLRPILGLNGACILQKQEGVSYSDVTPSS